MNPIPKSGKVPDFDITVIETVEEADQAIAWLELNVANMTGQIKFNVAKGFATQEWLARVGVARKKAISTKQAVEHLRGRLGREAKLTRQREVERQFMDTALDLLEQDQIGEIFKRMRTA